MKCSGIIVASHSLVEELKRVAKNGDDQVLTTLQTLLIVQLSQAGLSNADIRSVVGVAKERVNEVCKYLNKKRRGKKG